MVRIILEVDDDSMGADSAEVLESVTMALCEAYIPALVFLEESK